MPDPQVPRFTIVMATLEAASLVRRTIDSLLAQDFEDWELQLIDAASTDGTADIGHGYRDGRIQVLSEPDRGIGDAWNKGVRRSRGHWLIFLGAGDTLPANALVRLSRVCAPAAPAVVVYGDTAIESDSSAAEVVYGREVTPHGPWFGFPFLHPACATAREVFQKIGEFDATLRIAIDSDFLLRAWLAGIPFVPGSHTVVMLAGGVSDRRWLQANLEYADSVARHMSASTTKRRALRAGVHLRHWVFRRLRLSRPVAWLRRTFIFALVAGLNTALRVLPGFALRRWVLQAAGCRIDPTAAIHRGLRLFSLGRIEVGAHSAINRDVYIDNRRLVRIGRNVSIAHDTRLYTLGHDIEDPYFKLRGAPVTIGDRACLFAGAIVLPGVTIGEAAVVLPGTVVQGDVPPFGVVRPLNDLQFDRRPHDLRYQIEHKVWLST